MNCGKFYFSGIRALKNGAIQSVLQTMKTLFKTCNFSSTISIKECKIISLTVTKMLYISPTICDKAHFSHSKVTLEVGGGGDIMGHL